MIDTTINLCDQCPHRGDFPECLPNEGEIEFGNGPGFDNVISCVNYIVPEETVCRYGSGFGRDLCQRPKILWCYFLLWLWKASTGSRICLGRHVGVCGFLVYLFFYIFIFLLTFLSQLYILSVRQ